MPGPESTRPVIYRFGVFEFDIENRELRNQGTPVKLQDQPFRILAYLVQRPGALVSREELKRELWPQGTFVDFEHSLNTAIKKVRQALGEDAGSTEYLETVPRYGYRWVAPFLPPNDNSEPQPLQIPLTAAALPGRLPRRSTVALASGASLLLLFSVAMWSRRAANSTVMISNLRRLTADSGVSFQPTLSQDGALVAFSSDRGNAASLDIWVTQVSGGSPVRLTEDPADDTEPHFCPNGSVVFRSERKPQGVYIAAALGGRPMLLAEDGRRPQCSPDGSLVAYWTGAVESASSSRIHVVGAAGGTPKQLAPDLTGPRNPLWSPDGKFLLVVGASKIDAGHQWWLVPVNGGAVRQLPIRDHLRRAIEFSSPYLEPTTWVSKTGEVLFSATYGQTEYATAQTSLWGVAVSAHAKNPLGDVRQITAATRRHEGSSVASNGLIAFADVELNPDIWSVKVDHQRAEPVGEIQQLTSDKAWESRPMIRAGMTSLLFRSDRGGGWNFWQMDLSNGTAKPVTISREPKVWGAVSPDGRDLAYHTATGVYVTNLSTGVTRVVCEGCKLQVSDWLADGRTLLVNDISTGTLNALNITDGKSTVLLKSDTILLYGSVSPDSQRIAFIEVNRTNAASTIRIAPVREIAATPVSAFTRVDHDFVAPYTPQWSSDGKLLYFISDVEGTDCLWAARITPDVSRPWIAFPVIHFHNPQKRLRGSFILAGDRLYLGLHGMNANVWLGNLP